MLLPRLALAVPWLALAELVAVSPSAGTSWSVSMRSMNCPSSIMSSPSVASRAASVDVEPSAASEAAEKRMAREGAGAGTDDAGAGVSTAFDGSCVKLAKGMGAVVLQNGVGSAAAAMALGTAVAEGSAALDNTIVGAWTFVPNEVGTVSGTSIPLAMRVAPFPSSPVPSAEPLGVSLGAAAVVGTAAEPDAMAEGSSETMSWSRAFIRSPIGSNPRASIGVAVGVLTLVVVDVSAPDDAGASETAEGIEDVGSMSSAFMRSLSGSNPRRSDGVVDGVLELAPLGLSTLDDAGVSMSRAFMRPCKTSNARPARDGDGPGSCSDVETGRLVLDGKLEMLAREVMDAIDEAVLIELSTARRADANI